MVYHADTAESQGLKKRVELLEEVVCERRNIMVTGSSTRIPRVPPPFTAEVVYSQGGYQVDGHFEDFPPDVVRLRPMYALDGQEFKAVDELYPNDWCLESLGTEDDAEKYYLENQYCITYDEEPLKSYVAGKLERFYILLEITTESGVYQTQAAVVERGTPQSLFRRASASKLPFLSPCVLWTSGAIRWTFCMGNIRLRRERATQPNSRPPLLPDTLPLEIQLWPGNSGEMLTSGIVQVPATWKTLSSIPLMAGKQVILSDAVDELAVPPGTEVATPLGKFLLNEPVAFDAGSGQVHQVIDVVGKGEAPDVSLQENSYENSIDDIGALSLAFWLKPSGAAAITVYSFVEGDKDWAERCDLLDRRDLNHNQAMGIYGFVTLLQPKDPPFSDYLKNDSPFLIGLKIEGGTFDGETVVLPWPGDYTPPAGIPEAGGSEGNENNAGSGGGDSTDGGQRPNLPGKPEGVPETLPITPPPAEDGTQVPEEVEPTIPPEEAAPEQPQTDGGGTEKPSGGSLSEGETAVTVPPLISQPPQLGEGVPAVNMQTALTAESTPSAQTPSPRTEDVPAPSAGGKEIDAGRLSDNKSETENNNSSLPRAAAAAIVLVGCGIAVGAGVCTASGRVSGSVFLSKLLRTVRKLFSKR